MRPAAHHKAPSSLFTQPANISSYFGLEKLLHQLGLIAILACKLITPSIHILSQLLD